MKEIAEDSNSPKETGVVHAKFGRRLVAATIDIMLLAMAQIFLSELFFALKFPGDISIGDQLQNFFQNLNNPQPNEIVGNFFAFLSNNKILYVYIGWHLSTIFLMMLYVLYFWITRGATPGKMLTRCRIVDIKTLKKPTAKQCILRLLGYCISLLPLGLGFLMIDLNKQKRGLHDFIASTMVIVTKKGK